MDLRTHLLPLAGTLARTSLLAEILTQGSLESPGRGRSPAERAPALQVVDAQAPPLGPPPPRGRQSIRGLRASKAPGHVCSLKALSWLAYACRACVRVCVRARSQLRSSPGPHSPRGILKPQPPGAGSGAGRDLRPPEGSGAGANVQKRRWHSACLIVPPEDPSLG